MTAIDSAEEGSLVSHDCVTETIRRLLRNEILVAKRFTVEQLAGESGVKVRLIRAYMSNNPDEQREASLSRALSLAVVLGPRAVNALLGIIGYGGARPLDEPEEIGPAHAVAEMMGHVSVIAKAAADNRIDHIEEPITEQAADNIIDIAMQFSKRGRAA